MGVLKNDVGRPSNKVLKTRKLLKIVMLSLVILLFVIFILIVKDLKNVKASASGPYVYDIKQASKIRLESGKTFNRIHFIKTSSAADVILLESSGKFGLIDAGTSTENEDKKNKDIERIIKYMKQVGVTDKNLSFIQLSHNHGDHVNAVYSVIKNFKPKYLYMKRVNSKAKKLVKSYNGIVIETLNYKNIKQTDRVSIRSCISKSKEIDYSTSIINGACKGDYKKASIGFEDWNIFMYNVPLMNNISESSNAQSMITQVLYKGKSVAALYADMSYSARGGAEIAKKIGKVDLYKVAHHGNSDNWKCNTTTKATIEMLNNLKPKYSVITNNKDNSLIKNYVKVLNRKETEIKDCNAGITAKYSKSKIFYTVGVDYSAVVYDLDK